MTIAEIHGKISSSGGNLSDRMEDLLTSDVFGALRYLPAADGLLPVLRKAQSYSNPKENLVICDDPTQKTKVCFWPRLEHSALKIQVEPDVVIEHGNHVIMIEAKYLSGKSGSSEESDLETAGSDQLAKQFHVLKERYPTESKHTLIYLTAHQSFPKDDIDGGYNDTDANYKDDYEKNTYWLSWFKIRNAVEKLWQAQENWHKKLVLGDIKELLYRKGFRKFEGFGKIDGKVNPAPKRIFYQHAIGRFRGFEKLAIAKIDFNPEIIFYQRNN